MFLSLRDIAYARGRFALMTGVVGLITLLLVMLSGLTGGLGKQNTSGLEALNPDRYIFTSEKPSFTESAVTADDLQSWGDTDVTPLGVGQTRLEGETATSVGVFGLPAQTDIPDSDATVPDQGLVVSESVAKDAGADVGSTVELGGTQQKVVGVVPDLEYSHSPLVWASTATWQAATHAPDGTVGTVLLGNGDPDWDALADKHGDIAVTTDKAFDGLEAYKSEKGSLLTMQGFLYAISALVTVAFLTVWTIQRTRDLSILRALGASGGYLRRDALGQAAIVVGVGALGGALAGWGLGALAAGTVPFDLSLTTVLAPAVGIWVLGMAGAWLATRHVAQTDPLLALGGNA